MIVMIKTKYWVLFATVPLFIGILIGMSVQTIEAQVEDIREQSKAALEARYPSPSAAKPTVLNVLTEDMPSYMPSLVFVDMYTFDRLQRDTYAVMFTVTAGDQDLENIIVQCASDVFAHEIVIDSLKAFETTEGMSRVKALNPSSITGEIVAFQLAG